MHEACLGTENIWANYALLHKENPSSDSEAKVSFYQDNSHFIIRNTKSSNPELAIIIPAFNESEYIARTLASVNYSLRNHENVAVFVVDNASTDETSEIASAFGSHVVYEPRKGIGNARQTGLEAVPPSVKYILTTDADTVVVNDWLKSYKNTLTDPCTVASFGSICFKPDTPLSHLDRFLLSSYTLAANIVHIINNHHKSFVCGGSNMGFKKEIADICGGYNRQLSRGEDTDILNKMANLGRISKNNSNVVTSSRRIIGSGIVKHSIDRLKDNISRYTGKNPVSESDVYKDYR